MKNNLKFSVAYIVNLFVFVRIAYAQPDWNTGGNNITGLEYLGGDGTSNVSLKLKTVTSYPIDFFTNNTQKATILANGNVGIGTTAPNALLHLNSSASSPTVDVLTRYTNPNAPTTLTAGGLEVGINSAGDGIIRHWAHKPIEVWTISLVNPRRNTTFTNDQTFGSVGTLDTRGDGLRIHDPADNGGDLDLWTSTANQSHIVWGPNGRIQGINNRFEIQADFTDGLWFNVEDTSTGAFFNSKGLENGRIGSNTFWRIGANASNVNAARRLEVFDASNPQLRLTQSLTGPVFTDFQTIAGGHLLVRPLNNTSSGNVGINMTGAPFAKLEVNNSNRIIGTASYTTTNATSFNIGMFGYAQNAASANVGVVGNSPGQITFAGVPPVIRTDSGLTLVTLPMNIGVIGRAQGNTYNFGGMFEANQVETCPKMNIGVYASAAKSCHTHFPQGGLAGYFNGGTWSTSSWQTVSDVRFKDSIEGVDNALEIIARLRPHSYVYKADSFPYMNLSLRKSFGFIAQEVDTVLPLLVHSTLRPPVVDTAGNTLQDTMTIFGLNYTELIPFTIRAIQELDSLKVGATCTKADSNHVVKWSTVDKTLVNGQIYDDGSKIGIPTTAANVYVNVSNTGNSITAGKFEGGSKGLHGSVVGTNVKQHGVFGESKGASVLNIGVEGDAKRSTSAYNVGVSGVADSSSVANIAVLGQSAYNTNSATNVGVYTTAANSRSQNVAGQFIATDTFGLNYGVYGEAHSPTAGSPAFAGYFSGNVHATGVVTWSSDATLKNNIADVDSRNALASLLRLSPKTYSYKTSDYPYLDLPQGSQYGLIAQEVEQVFPQLVSDITHPEVKDTEGKVLSPRMQYKGLNYAGLIPILVGAVKQQQTKIDSLQQVIDTRLSEIENRLARCCGSGKTDEGEGTETHRINVELSNMQVVVLEQNVPNPFAEQTAINYFIPEDAAGAQMLFFDAAGKVLKTLLLEKGNGIVTVFAGNLSSGTYSYSLLVDGKAVETKRMVKGK